MSDLSKCSWNSPKNGAPNVSTSAKDGSSAAENKGGRKAHTNSSNIPTSNPYDLLSQFSKGGVGRGKLEWRVVMSGGWKYWGGRGVGSYGMGLVDGIKGVTWGCRRGRAFAGLLW
ncbi:hypothetical protein Tco_1044556 [Tanacetum coccineum]|uniref:Uncharacterized protein n=1 Tax=Tanacetum coccineum TaxID=301880 RepID=A0ABQ5GRH8_9ASTR